MTEPRRSSVLRNIGFNFTGAAVPLLVTLFTVPVYLSHVGAARYGVILVAWSLLGYFGFLDLGISRATTNALSKLAHDGPVDAKTRVFWSSFLVNASLGTIGGLILLVCGSLLFGYVVKISPDVRPEALAAMPYIACMLPVALMLGVGVGTAEAHEAFGRLNIIQTTGLVLGQALPLASVMLYGPSLTHIMPIMLGVRFATLVGVTILAVRVGGVSLRPQIDRGVLGSLLGFGGWVTVTNVISPIMTSIDQFVIGSIKGVAAVPFYAVPLNIIARSQIVPTTLTRTLFPILSRQSQNEGRALVASSLMYLNLVMTPIYIAGVFLGGDFLRIWIGAEMMARGAPVFRLLCVGAWANSLAFILFTAIQGRGKPRTVALIHTCEVLPYLGLLWLLIGRFGITGAAMAWATRTLADALALALACGLGRRSWSAVLPGFAAMIAAFVLAQAVTGSLVTDIVGALFVIGCFLAVTIVINGPPHEALALLRSVLSRRRARAARAG